MMSWFTKIVGKETESHNIPTHKIMSKTKYSKQIKQRAAELYELRDSRGKRIYTGKKLASELGVSKDVAFYLEYTGRSLQGVLPPKRAYKPRYSKGFHNKRTQATQEQVNNFVEENIYQAEETSNGSSRAVVIYAIVMTALVAFVLGTYVINWVVNSLV